MTNHDALGYFMAEYGLRFVGSIYPSLDVSAEPDPAQLAALADTIRAQGVTAIFSEQAVNPKLARAIAGKPGRAWSIRRCTRTRSDHPNPVQEPIPSRGCCCMTRG